MLIANVPAVLLGHRVGGRLTVEARAHGPRGAIRAQGLPGLLHAGPAGRLLV